MGPPAFTPIGRVVKPHGLDGELSVKPSEDLSEFPVGVEVWFVPPPASAPRSGKIIAVRQGPKGPLVSIEGITHISDAESLRGRQLVARPDDVQHVILEPPADLLGFTVRDTHRGEIGTVSEVIATGANDVLVVTGGPFGEVLVPDIDDVVLEIDAERRVCEVLLLPGLIEGD